MQQCFFGCIFLKEFNFSMSTQTKLFQTILNKFKNPEDIDLIKRSYLRAKELHKGQKRKSLEDYIEHPLAVAHIIVHKFYYRDAQTIAAAFLHDCLEDCSNDIQMENLEEEFGLEVANIVQGLTKIEKHTFTSKSLVRKKNLEKFLRATADNFKVLIIKLADRYHNLQTLSSLTLKQQKNISRETLDYYSPLAKSIGLFDIYCDITDLALKHHFKEGYKKLSRKINRLLEKDRCNIENLKLVIKEELNKNNIACHIKILHKGPHSFYEFNKKRFSPIHEILDDPSMYRIVIILKSISQTYRAIGCIHNHPKFSLIPNSIIDLIAMPRKNGFQSLISRIKFNGKTFQFQYRTKKMDEIAKRGILFYLQTQTAESSPVFPQVKELLLDLSEESSVGLGSSTKEIYRENEAVVFIDGDKPLSIPNDYTLLDLAFEANRGNIDRVQFLIGGISENKKCFIYDAVTRNKSYKLCFGSKIELKNAWLLHAKSPLARYSIKKWLDEIRSSSAHSIGNSMVKHYLDLFKIDKGLFEGTDNFKKYLNFKQIKQEKTYKIRLKDFYEKIGFGIISIHEVLYYFGDSDLLKLISNNKCEEIDFSKIDESPFQYTIKNIEDYFLKFSGCCKTILPESKNAVGLATPRGITLHEKQCNKFVKTSEKHLNRVKINWKLKKKEYLTSLTFRLLDKPGSLNMLFSQTPKYNLNIRNISTRHELNSLFVTLSFSGSFEMLNKYVQYVKGASQYLALVDRSVEIL